MVNGPFGNQMGMVQTSNGSSVKEYVTLGLCLVLYGAGTLSPLRGDMTAHAVSRVYSIPLPWEELASFGRC